MPSLCTYQSFAPPPPMRANEGADQGIRLKFCPQGRGISFASRIAIITYQYLSCLFNSIPWSLSCLIHFITCILLYWLPPLGPTFV